MLVRKNLACSAGYQKLNNITLLTFDIFACRCNLYRTVWDLFRIFQLHPYFVLHRFSDEIRSGKVCSQTIDWSELAKAAEAAQKKNG